MRRTQPAIAIKDHSSTSFNCIEMSEQYQKKGEADHSEEGANTP
jgi:hypothetical protein